MFAAACAIDGRAVTVDGGVPIVATRVCQGIAVQQDLITDFSDAVLGTDLEGGPGILYGRGPVQRGGASEVFAAPGLKFPQLSLEPHGTDQALRIEAKPVMPVIDNPYLGFALGFGRDAELCVDATGYRGVAFTLDGTTGTCQLMFQVLFSQDFRVGLADPAGACTLGELCYPPFSRPLAVNGPATYAIEFADLVNPGNPVAGIDPQTIRSIVNVGWKLFPPLGDTPCQASLLLDDVAFFR
jgi:hypothetical protein